MRGYSNSHQAAKLCDLAMQKMMRKILLLSDFTNQSLYIDLILGYLTNMVKVNKKYMNNGSQQKNVCVKSQYCG